MEQLPLSFVPRIPYGEQNFVLHSGVASAYQLLIHECEATRFSLAYVYGLPRTGKSHMAIALTDYLKSQHQCVHMLAGEDAFVWCKNRLAKSAFRAGEIVIIDDADLFLNEFSVGQSGLFVNLVESARPKNCSLLFFSSVEHSEFQVDDHIASRLTAGQQLSLEDPAEDELLEIITALGYQYGMELSSRCASYLSKRLPRSIKGIERYIQALESYSQKAATPIGMKLVSEVLEEALPGSNPQ